MNAISVSLKGRFYEILTDVGISKPVKQEETMSKPVTTYWGKCLWDTGASQSAVSERTAQALGLGNAGQGIIHYAKGEELTNLYYVGINLPGLIFIPELKVTECSGTDEFDFIIGMDIISMGDFAITNYQGNAMFSFRVPSAERIDFREP